jgi:hypothetical protein
VLNCHIRESLARDSEKHSAGRARPVHINAQATTELVVDSSRMAEEGEKGCFDCRFRLKVVRVEDLEVLESALYTIKRRDGSQTYLFNLALEFVCGVLSVKEISKDLHEPYRQMKTLFSATDVVADNPEGMSCL